MHITVNLHQFKEAIQYVSKAVSPRTTIPILTGIKISVNEEELTLTGSDSDISIQTTIPQEADGQQIYEVHQEGSIVLPARYFVEIVKKLPGEKIEIEVKDQFITHITSGNTAFDLHGLDAQEYPALPQIEEKKVFSMSGQLLKQMIRQTVFAVSIQESRPILTGVLWELATGELKMVATDSHRLAKRTAQVECDAQLAFNNIVIPGKSLIELQKIIADDEQLVDIVIMNNQLLIKVDRLLFFSRLLEGTYPDTDRIIPKESKTQITLETKGFADAIERASLLAKDGKHIIKLHHSTQEELQITSHTPEIGKVSETIPVVSSHGVHDEIAFNAKYLLEALRAMSESQIKIEITGGMSPFMLKPTDHEEMLHLVLPIRT